MAPGGTYIIKRTIKFLCYYLNVDHFHDFKAQNDDDVQNA